MKMLMMLKSKKHITRTGIVEETLSKHPSTIEIWFFIGYLKY
jgi:hypothetical protein